jgi:signal transduction histidine kinase
MMTRAASSVAPPGEPEASPKPAVWPSRLAWCLALLCFGMIAVSAVLLYLNRSALYSFSTDFSTVVPTLTFGAIGGLIAARRPSNPIGWLLLTIGVSLGINELGVNVVLRGLLTGASPRGWIRWPAWLETNMEGLPLGAFALVALLFPTGTALSRRWRWVVIASTAVVIAFSIAAALDTTVVEVAPNLPRLANPIGVAAFKGYTGLAGWALSVPFILGAVALFLRLRRSKGEERQQVKWFAYAVAVTVGMFVVLYPVFYAISTAAGNAMGDVAFDLGFAVAVPGAAALAILRYGLYEVDVVINKTIVYLCLAAVITAIYVAVVVGIGAAIGSKGNVLLSVLATAIVAVAFQPIRDRTRHFANRLVYGKRATPYEVLSDFADRMAATYSIEDVLPRTARILGEATGAVRADVWLVSGRDLDAAASWPSAAAGPRLHLVGSELPAIPGASRVAPVRHQGELLGALSIQKAPGDPVSPAEEKLVIDLASQAGLILRNARLIEDLRASRVRLVQAQDEERRRLERNIHDGAQQQLVALAVKANLAEQFVGRDEAKERALIAQLKVEAQEALENLRDLARGIYPPLLADQGLAAALIAQARKSPVPVTVEADGIGRYSQDAEAAVYFCTLEALQNVAKYAGATAATVHLTQSAGHLGFEVVDDGVGFDTSEKGYGTGTQGMADRLAALGGELAVTSSPGKGTIVRGWIPVAT